MAYQHGYMPQNNDERFAADGAGYGQMQQREQYQTSNQTGWPQQPTAMIPQNGPSASAYSYSPALAQSGGYAPPHYYHQGPQEQYFTPPTSVQYQPAYQQSLYPSNLQQPSHQQYRPPSPDPLQFYQSPPRPRQQSLQTSHYEQPALQSQARNIQTQQNGGHSQDFGWSSSPALSQRPLPARDFPAAEVSHLPQTVQQTQASQRPPITAQIPRDQFQQHHVFPTPQPSHPNQRYQPSSQASPVLLSQQTHGQATVNPQMFERNVVHVDTPVQRAPDFSKSTMAQPSKPRKSSDSLSKPKSQITSSASFRSHQAPVLSSPLTELPSSQLPPTPPPPDVDYQAVLVNLSDEYIGAAYNMSKTLSSPDTSEEWLEQYHSLLSTGMACLQSVLNNFRFSDARREARIRLRLASLLHEETDNDMETEEILSKGVTVCERARLVDTKYAMHHLLARVWFQGGQRKAAMKAVDQFITETEKLGLAYWTYAFRLLRLSLGSRTKSTQAEISASLRNLTALVTLADQRGDVAVKIVASTLEALFHLRSTALEGVDHAQRAIATARSHQLAPEMAAMPQARALIDSLDLACQLLRFNAEQAEAKMRTMHASLDSFAKSGVWSKDGTWLVPIAAAGTSQSEIVQDTSGIFQTAPSGEVALALRWLDTTEVTTLGFLLSGLASMHKNTTSELKAEAFLNEGLKSAKIAPRRFSESMVAASARIHRQRVAQLTLGLYRSFAYCGRCEWSLALESIREVRSQTSNAEPSIEPAYSALFTYLEAVCKHGLGDLSEAFKLYRSPALSLDLDGQTRLSITTADPIRVLASLNSILISRQNGAAGIPNGSIDRMEHLCLTHINENDTEYGNKAIEAAYYVLKATITSQDAAGDGVIIRTKQYLQAALHAAKASTNNHLLCVVLTIMTDLFFTNIVGEQAEKSARAGKTLAKKSQDRLWMAVADRMYADTLELCGKTNEAAQARAEAEECMRNLPQSLREALPQ